MKAGRISRRDIYTIVLLPVVAIAGYSTLKIEGILAQAASARRHAIATLAATVLNEKFDRLSDIGSSLVTRVRFVQSVERGRWREAISIMEAVPKTFPFIDRVFLTDEKGTLMADTPALPGMIGKNFAFRDWYRGVQASGRPYVSEVYKRSAPPQYDMIALAAPIRGVAGTVRGVLVLQIRASTLLDWINGIPQEMGGNVEIMDQKGHPASRRRFLNEDGAASGERDGAVVIAVPKYGWSVVARQTGALSAGSRALRILLVVYGLLLMMSYLMARVLSRMLETLERNEAELIRARDAALESARFKSEFVANISHEMRTPLNAIIGINELLLDSGLTGAQREDLQNMSAAGGVLLALINDILDFSKLEAGKMIFESQDFDLQRLIDDAAALFGRAARNKGLRLTASVPAQTPLALRGDSRRLHQILANLLSNAVKFTEHGEVRLEARKERESETEAWILFQVHDTGIGIPPDQAARLFQAFVQADSSTTRKYGGTGLGLAISKMLAELMGGTIGVDSAAERGSTFWLRLKFSKAGIAEHRSNR